MDDKMQFNVDKCGIICLGTNNQKEEQLLSELVCIVLTRNRNGPEQQPNS
jgi:hypothetical protein